MMNRLFRWGIIMALLVLGTSSFIALKIVFGDNKGAEVPPLIGLSAVEAANLLQGAGLSARIDQVDSNHLEGTVISQSMSPGEKTDRGKIVTLKVSRGGTQIRIPDVRGKEFAAAAQELDTAGFKIGAVVRVSDQLKQPGTIIAQNPAAPAMVLNNRMVDLLVSEGGTGRAETVQVPDLRNQNEAQARQIIEQSDLEVSKVITIESTQAAPGAVVRTEPKAGARVPVGRGVAIYIARLPDPKTQENVPVPAETGAARPDVIATQPGTSSGGTNETQRQLAAELPTWSPGQQPAAPPPRASVPQTPPGNQNPAQGTTGPLAPATGKIAKVRYQVPPLVRSMALKIQINDQAGVRILREAQVSGGEYVTMDAPYSGNAAVTVQLGGEQVWQERYN